MFLVSNLQVQHAGGVGCMAIVARQLATPQRLDVRRCQVKRVVELECVRVFKLVREHLEFGMVGGERADDLRVAVLWTRPFKQDAALLGTVIKRFGRERFTLFV